MKLDHSNKTQDSISTKKWHKKWWGILIIILVVLIGLMSIPFVGIKMICSQPFPERYTDDVKKQLQAFCSGVVPVPKDVFMYDENTPINEVPMYGFDNYEQYLNERKPELAKVDNQFIKNIENTIKKFNSNKEEASNDLAQIGWGNFYKKDFKTAIKKFNQSWLIKHDNPNAYWGFSEVLKVQGKCAESSKMAEKAIEAEKQTGILKNQNKLHLFYADYGSTNLFTCYKTHKEDKQYLKKAIELLEKSLSIKYEPSECIYSQLAIALYYFGDNENSLKKLKLAEKSESTGCEKFLSKELKKEIKSKTKTEHNFLENIK